MNSDINGVAKRMREMADFLEIDTCDSLLIQHRRKFVCDMIDQFMRHLGYGYKCHFVQCDASCTESITPGGLCDEI